MIPLTLARYFAWRFLGAALAVFVGVFVLVVLIDYVELMRRASQIPNVSAWTVAKTSFFRVPQVTERLMPFAVLIGAMSCFLNLSRRLELIVARAAGYADEPLETEPVGPGSISTLVLDIGKLTETLGWRPEWSLEDGIAEVLAQMRRGES